MQLAPRYDDPELLEMTWPGGPGDPVHSVDPSVAVVGQRRRLADLAATFDAAQWAAPSRCEGWSTQDVMAHLVSTNQFWALSIRSGLAGTPTRFLATFDPVTSPAELVASVRSQTADEVLERFVATNDDLAAAIAEVGHDGWDLPGEAPPGHVPLRAVASHGLWDSWVHERDIVLPLGLGPVEDATEVAVCLVYAAALSPLFAAASGSGRRGAIEVVATDPGVQAVVEVGTSVRVHAGDAPAGALRLTGPAVDLLEALSFRGPMPCPVPDGHRWLLAGLAQVFDRVDA